jgi:hypothetical protein
LGHKFSTGGIHGSQLTLEFLEFKGMSLLSKGMMSRKRGSGGRSEEMMRKQEELSQKVCGQFTVACGWLEFWFGMYSPHWLHSEDTLMLCPSISAETTLEVFLLPVLCSLDELKAVFGEDDMDL